MIKSIWIAIISVLFLFIIVGCEAETQNVEENASKPEIVTDYNYSYMELETVRLINEYRISNGLDSLKIINHLSYKAEEHTIYMIGKKVPSHDDFVKRSQDITEVLGAKKVAENVAYNYRSAEGALNGWLNSPEHKEVILGDFNYFGISIKADPETGKNYFTTIFIKL
ncbi:CAP domain-containing protein [Flavobacterium zhairuonense]|uniref:CAP domain-containing protein n=1 Tax=Flavobacterium zhairuonense TaxID=2493631 RepID=UPI00104ACDE4|nr:CAP domain-containing protein [Flavobacterium zhairuonense]KAF2514767.1 CAP domain-containing protein [Flavobacterium zhairuonense]